MLKFKKYLLIICLFSALGVISYAQNPTQTPTPDEIEKVLIEEIKLNVAALDTSGQFISDLKKEDLVIVEDGRLQQASSARRVPANVLIVLDTGGEMRSNLSVTREAAKSLVKSLQSGVGISVFQFGDKVEMLSGWTTDKAQIFGVLDKKPAFGRRSVFIQALDSAIKFFYKTPHENRHLVLITNGADSFNDPALRDSVKAKLMTTDINVHVISYTKLQKGSIASRKSIFVEGEFKPRRMPEEVADTLPDWKGAGKKKLVSPRDMAKMPRLGGVTLDRERIKRANDDLKKLDTDELFLTMIAEDTSGEILLPETFDEAIEKTNVLAQIIDSQYVITYAPRRLLKDSPKGEVRQIEVSSKRNGLQVEAQRKLIVQK
ncbi:MAG: VWA domain-containing protein [Pyrinomonadaceae bacterium]